MGLFDLLGGLFGGSDDSDGEAGDDEGTTRNGDGGPDQSLATSSIGDVVGGSPDAFREDAEEFVDVWGEYDLDYDPDSLSRLDDLLASQQDHATYMEVEIDDVDTVTFSPIAASAACYAGETLVRNYDAEWVREGDGWAIEIEGDEVATLNVFHVAHDCLAEEPKFAATLDVLEGEVGL